MCIGFRVTFWCTCAGFTHQKRRQHFSQEINSKINIAAVELNRITFSMEQDKVCHTCRKPKEDAEYPFWRIRKFTIWRRSRLQDAFERRQTFRQCSLETARHLLCETPQWKKQTKTRKKVKGDRDALKRFLDEARSERKAAAEPLKLKWNLISLCARVCIHHRRSGRFQNLGH